jgi:hypothetical protein
LDQRSGAVAGPWLVVTPLWLAAYLNIGQSSAVVLDEDRESATPWDCSPDTTMPKGPMSTKPTAIKMHNALFPKSFRNAKM